MFKNCGQKKHFQLPPIGIMLGTGLIAISSMIPIKALAQNTSSPILMWTNHLNLLPGDSSVITSFNATSSGVGTGLSGLVINSTTAGFWGTSGGMKVVQKGLDIPPGYKLNGVRICYELSNPGSYINQIRLAQVQNPPRQAFVLLDDGKAQLDKGPICVDSQKTSIDPSQGPVLLSLRVNFGSPTDKIVIRGLGLYLTKQ